MLEQQVNCTYDEQIVFFSDLQLLYQPFRPYTDLAAGLPRMQKCKSAKIQKFQKAKEQKCKNAKVQKCKSLLNSSIASNCNIINT